MKRKLQEIFPVVFFLLMIGSLIGTLVTIDGPAFPFFAWLGNFIIFSGFYIWSVKMYRNRHDIHDGDDCP